jgi:DNA-binding beta-propeller fold protein YncE
MGIMQAVPMDALYLCYFERADILNETIGNPSSGWSRFAAKDKPLLQLLQKLQNTASSNEAASALLQAHAVVSAHPQGKNNMASLLAVELSQECPPQQIEAIIKDKETTVNIQAYHGAFITSVGNGNNLLYFSSVNNIALFSESLLILQNAIRHLNSGSSLLDDEQFQKVTKTTGTTDVRLFINHRSLNLLAAATGSDKWKKQADVLPYTANWTALDGQASPHLIHLSGFIFPSFTDDNYLSILLSQSGAGTSAWNVLPAETAMALNMGVPNVARFLNGYKKFLNEHKQLTAYKNNISALNEQAQTNVEELFASFYVEETGIAYIHGPQSAGWVTFFKTANSKYVSDHLRTLANELKKPFLASGKDAKNAIYHNPIQGLLPTLFGSAFEGNGDALFMIHNNWVVFGNNPEVLQAIRTAPVSLKKHIQSTRASQYCSNNSSLSFFLLPAARNNAELLSYLRPSLKKEWTNALNNDVFKVAAIQLKPAGDKLYTTFFAIYDSEEKPSERTTAKTVSDITMTKPAPSAEPQPATLVTSQKKFPVINHTNKQTEYLVQNDKNGIALVDKNGKELWKQTIDGPIVDTLYQLDFYKNGKLQMLFITANKIYLTDRRGQTVAPFPLSLSAAGKYLAVFDYNKDKEYRLFMVQNNSVRVYDKKGRTVDGWKTFTPEAPITRAPAFFRAGGRDYIVVCDEKTMHILDRKGNERIALQSEVAVKPGTAITLQQQPPTLKVTTTQGKTVTVNLKDGTVK